MPSKTEPQCLFECLHDAVVKDMRLEGLDLVLDVGLLVDRAKEPNGPRPPEGRACRPSSESYQLVFQGFHGRIPWGLKVHRLELLQEKDGAYLLVTDSLEEHVVWARSLSLRLPASAKDGDPLFARGARP